MSTTPSRPAAHLWHPFADMSTVPAREVVIVSGDGAWVTDTSGRRYLDASAALWYCNVGHGRAELGAIAAEQMGRLASYQLFDVFATEPAIALADRLCALAPLGEGSAAFLTSGGSDSVDTAAKIARRYWALRGRPQRDLIIAREGAYHGMHGWGTSLAGIAPNAEGWGPLVEGVVHVGRHDTEGLAAVFDRHADRIAAFIGEPVQGAAGVHPPVPGYWAEVRRLCAEHNVLLIADEVITGFGRVGTWFACERYGIEPDLLLCAKGLSSGYLPIGAVIASAEVLSVLWAQDAGVFRHGYTYSGHAAACAVALGNLDILAREGLVDRVAQLEEPFARTLSALGEHPLVGEVRTAGLLCGAELSAAAREADPTVVEQVVVEARSRDVLVRNLVGRGLQISPPFVITEEEIALLADVLLASLDAVAARSPALSGSRRS